MDTTSPVFIQENLIHHWLLNLNIPTQWLELCTTSLLAFIIICTAVIITVMVRRFILPLALQWIRMNNYTWDDALVANRFLEKLSWFIPFLVVSFAVDITLIPQSSMYLFIKRATLAGYVVVSATSISALLNSINDINKLTNKSGRYQIQAYIDAAKIIIYVLGLIFITSIFTGKSPWGIVSILGGLTAVTMLIFKDSILGFVASIQISSSQMVRIGDWIEMPQYGADGDVIAMSIHTIKVQNWDKTISSIPTYALVSSSFKNWRGMSESGGRRIKRSINIDISSIHFADDTLLNRLARIELLKDYLQQKTTEITESNKTINTNTPVNGRQQTNVGIFRAYIIAYLQQNKNIHDNMTFLVRQLQPGPTGLPIEIYVFSKDQVWANYEAIQADIFDHLLAAIPVFNLRVFQNPTGYDMQKLHYSSITQ